MSGYFPLYLFLCLLIVILVIGSAIVVMIKITEILCITKIIFNDGPDVPNYYFLFLFYRLAIFQLLNDIEAKAPLLAFVSFCLGCVNVPLYLFLLIGAIFRRPCPLLFWLIFALLELLLIGIPMIIFIGIICLYLACQLQMYIWASVLMGKIWIEISRNFLNIWYVSKTFVKLKYWLVWKLIHVAISRNFWNNTCWNFFVKSEHFDLCFWKLIFNYL